MGTGKGEVVWLGTEVRTEAWKPILGFSRFYRAKAPKNTLLGLKCRRETPSVWVDSWSPLLSRNTAPWYIERTHGPCSPGYTDFCALRRGTWKGYWEENSWTSWVR